MLVSEGWVLLLLNHADYIISCMPSTASSGAHLQAEVQALC
jgi:hypothetical protein